MTSLFISILHVLIGGLSAELGGGSFAAGAEGAGSAEASRNLLKNLPPDLQQWGSAIIGAATAKVIGNNDSIKVIHINPNTIPSGIDRSQFNKWKSNYWKNRANDFKKQGDI